MQGRRGNLIDEHLLETQSLLSVCTVCTYVRVHVVRGTVYTCTDSVVQWQ